MIQQLKNLNACSEAIGWLSTYTDYEQAWNECKRGDWLLWLVTKLEIDHRRMTLAKARCAKLVVHLMEDKRSVKAVEVAENYGLGIATLEELNIAAYAAYDATTATATAAYAADAAAYAAAYAATTTTAATATAATAAYTADATAAAYAYADADADARQKTLIKCADIVRSIFNYEEVKEISTA